MSREDNLLHFGAHLSAPLLKKGSAGVFFRANENASSQTGFRISSTQVGFELGYHY